MYGFSHVVAVRRREMLHTTMLVGLDSAAMVAAFELGRKARGSSGRPFADFMSQGHFLALILATVPIWVAIFAICGLYKVQVNGGRVSEVGRVVAAVVGGVTLLTSIAYLSYGVPIFPSRSVPLFAVLFGVPLVVLERQLVRVAMRELFARGRALQNVVIVGTGPLADRIATALASPTSGYRLLAAVSRSAERDRAPSDLVVVERGRVPIHPTIESVMEAYPDRRINEIIQADVDVDRDAATRLMSYTNENGIGFRFVPDQYGVYASASTMRTIDGIPVMEVRLTSLDGWGAVGKRMFDVIGAALLLIVGAPFMVILAAAVKIAEPGAPILYKQNRVGLGGKQIGVLKFRTMSWRYSTGPDREFHTAEDAFMAMGRADLITEFQVNHKVADDPRVSKLGRFLRKTSLDELPQLLNALHGDLSLVGPRPITQRELDRYGTQAISFLALKPGITGLWQVYGRSTTTYEERVKLDIYYVENWSIGMDISILARTLVSVAARKGAV